MKPLSLITLNIERAKHLDLVLPFLERQQADVICLQEVMREDVGKIALAARAQSYRFEPMGNILEEPGTPMGVAIFSTLQINEAELLHYSGQRGAVPTVQLRDPATYNNVNAMVLFCGFENGCVVGTTHFPWTPDGSASDKQRRDMRALLAGLQDMEEFVLCGDFNAPRGGEIYEMIAGKYKDNVPPQYKTSLDISLHRHGMDRAEELKDKMVDYIFSTEGYEVSDVNMVRGVSDHCALTANAVRRT